MLEFHVEHYLTLCPPASAEPTTQMVRHEVLGTHNPCIAQSNGLASLSPFPSWPDCIINTSGYDFGKDRYSRPGNGRRMSALRGKAAMASAELNAVTDREATGSE
jgi:hypothetical protein